MKKCYLESRRRGHPTNNVYELLSKYVFEGKVEMTGRRGRRRKLILNDLAEAIGHWKLKEEAPDRNLLRTRFGGGCGLVLRRTMR